MAKNNKAAGTARERQLVKYYRNVGYIAFRTPASLGVCDVIAIKAGERPMFIEVKANVGSPYMHFRKEKREELRQAAAKAGAIALLCHWPPHGAMRMIPEREWPA